MSEVRGGMVYVTLTKSIVGSWMWKEEKEYLETIIDGSVTPQHGYGWKDNVFSA